MTILITGVAGFLGSHLAEHFLLAGETVIGIDNFYTGSEKNISFLEKLGKKFHFLKEDVVNLNADYLQHNQHFLKSFYEVNQIYHMACPASPPCYQKDMLYTMDTCYFGTKNVFELASKWKARVLIASTSEVYGDPLEHPQKETYRGNVSTFGPRSCYDEGKRAGETLAYIYQSQRGLDVRVARIFNTYGPRMAFDDGRVVTSFVVDALRGKDLSVFGDGSQTRSFCYVTDLVLGLKKLMNSNEISPTNIGTDFEFTVKNLAEKVIARINSNLKVTYKPLPVDDPKVRRADNSKAKLDLGWIPVVSLDEGLDLYIQWCKENLIV